MDLILGQFADAHIDSFGEADLACFEDILEIDDRDLLQWVTGETVTPSEHDTALFRKIRAYGQSGLAC